MQKKKKKPKGPTRRVIQSLETFRRQSSKPLPFSKSGDMPACQCAPPRPSHPIPSLSPPLPCPSRAKRHPEARGHVPRPFPVAASASPVCLRASFLPPRGRAQRLQATSQSAPARAASPTQPSTAATTFRFPSATQPAFDRRLPLQPSCLNTPSPVDRPVQYISRVLLVCRPGRAPALSSTITSASQHWAGAMAELLRAAGFFDLRGAAPFVVAAAVAMYFLVEQLSYLRKKGPLPGPSLVVPFLGSAVRMIRDPTGFWDAQAARARESGAGLAADFLFGRFIVFVRDSELSHRVFANVRPDAFHLIGHPFGKRLFGDHNLIYMFGEDHKDLRRRITPNFTPRALSTYAAIQQRVILAHLRRWLDQSAATGEAMPIRVPCRDMNLETSQTVFVGSYLSEKARERFAKDYALFNLGLMSVPVDLPGFAFRRARLAVARLVRTLGECARKSKARMRAGGEPECLVDYWMQETLREMDEAAAAGRPPPAHTGDEEFGGFLFDFLFAAQDASTSSLCWAVSALDSHPDVLARVRAEVAAAWSPESGKPITAEKIQGMRYTQAVAREVVRHRPPATLVPHVAGEAFQLTEWYAVPKGAMVFPSVYESSFQGFASPDAFDPERFFSEARREDVACKRNFLAFGAGAHQCVGQRYALNHLVLFLALFVSVADFRRDGTPGCDEPVYMPTIVPRDGCAVYMEQRCRTFPSF
ncbi:hypothetical protein VPH35_043631 [Triticum aestivum]